MKKIKTGFSMVELLFVMAVMAALAAIAIPNLSGGQDAATATALKSDAKNFINTVNAEKLLNDGSVIITDSVADGDTYGSHAVHFTDATTTIAMADESGTCTEGYSIKVENSAFTTKDVTYNSCTDSAPKLVAGT